jgi:hypothetical protein
MNTIAPFPSQLLEKEMSQQMSLAIAMFLGAALGGYYCIDTIKRWTALEKQVAQLEIDVHESDAIEQANSQLLEEVEQRLREKKDYDEADEIQEAKYQAWRGEYTEETCKVEIQLWREKEMAIKENQEWTSLTLTRKDSSIASRDFYLGNLHPEFQWEVREGDYYYITTVRETFVESWGTSIKLEIFMTFPSKESLLQFVEQPSSNGNLTLNAALKKCLETNLIQWQKILIDPK